MNLKSFSTAAILLLAATLSFGQSLTFKSYIVGYTVKNAGFNSTGKFDKMTATASWDENNLANSKFSATVKVASFNSAIKLRDEHLSGTGYFDAAAFPNITLVSTKIEKSGADYIGTFNLTIKGKVKSVKVPFSVTKNGTEISFNTNKLVINRLEFGIGEKSLTLSDNVTVNIKATFTK